MNLLLSVSTFRNLIIIFLLAVLVTAIIVLAAKYFTKNTVKYSTKASLLTECEKKYYEAIQEVLGSKYIVLPQVNLASVINKDTPGFRNELFRNVDFGVFDYNLTPLALIEINDASHLRQDRQDRDLSVKKICKKARIPLVTFWTKDGIDKNRLASVFRRIL